MKKFFKAKFVGGRIYKTGIAVFVTAALCQYFNLPAIFAVITAIVTIEPTASDSIKKGVVRFPASAIGAAYSMIFTYIFGDQAITYALSAVLTIITCHKLKLEAGILVATLTAVNMIPTTHDHYLESFFVRLTTTSIGLAVSTLVNIFIFPPNYSKDIVKNTAHLYEQSANLLMERIKEMMNGKINKNNLLTFEKLMKQVEKTEQLCQFQREEWKYHRHTKLQMREYHYEHKKLFVIRQILYHIGNLIYMPVEKDIFNSTEKLKVNHTIKSISNILSSENHNIPKEHSILINDLSEEFWQMRKKIDVQDHTTKHQHFPSKAIIYFELLSIDVLAQDLQKIHKSEWKQQAITVPVQKFNKDV
ncbi:aromatic acid exporter family protein [Cytobacillus sp. FJAT-54145]|uniref:Aromatic acid exporter family protein n=1 Tax=Cytobacillus spartinae TaxID=3299023 RepID=A0ABW6KCW5_9BACI